MIGGTKKLDLKDKKPVLVTGNKRTGTTYVGRVICRHDEFSYIHEPFSIDTGMKGVKHMFPYSSNLEGYYGKLLESILNLNTSYKYSPPLDRGKIAGIVKKIIGGSADWRWWLYKYYNKYNSRMLIKDPFSSLLSHLYIKEYGIKVICMVRHPYAFYYSNKRLGWDFNPNSFIEQNTLLEDYFEEEVRYFKNDLEYSERLALLWRCIYKYFSIISEQFDSTHLLFVRHEDLCERPMATFDKIFNFLGLSKTKKITDYIVETTSDSNETETPGETHNLKRDSNQLKNYWQGKISEREKNKMEPYLDTIYKKYYQ